MGRDHDRNKTSSLTHVEPAALINSHENQICDGHGLSARAQDLEPVLRGRSSLG